MANLDVFGVTPGYDLAKAQEVLEAKLNPSWVKQRKQGGATLSYIGGHTVIRLLNKAFGYQWSFEIVSEEIVQSVPKIDKYKNNAEIPQPPVAKVLGRLTVPGLGIKEQYGSKVLIGGATEQESAFKSASTDAMKKCASLFGIGLELYGDDEGFGDESSHGPVNTPVPPQQQQYQKQYQAPPQQQYQAPPQEQQYQQAPPQQQSAPQQQASAAPGGWVQADIDRLKELKAILGVTDNKQLDPYVREFFDNPQVTFANITPENIKAVNIFLAKKAESL